MSQSFDAIYEHGVLRPITPLNLAESARVTCVVHEAAEATNSNVTASADEIARQQQALNAMFSEIDKIPQKPATDNFSNRDHDFLIYGNIK